MTTVNEIWTWNQPKEVQRYMSKYEQLTFSDASDTGQRGWDIHGCSGKMKLKASFCEQPYWIMDSLYPLGHVA